MKTYELTYIISPEITSEESEVLTKEIESFIQSKEGVILNKINPTAKTLSYPIKKHASGFMVVLEFQVEPEILVELKEYLKNPPAGGEKIVRHIIIIKKPIKIRKERRTKRPTAPILKKEEKEDEKIQKFLAQI